MYVCVYVCILLSFSDDLQVELSRSGGLDSKEPDLVCSLGSNPHELEVQAFPDCSQRIYSLQCYHTDIVSLRPVAVAQLVEHLYRIQIQLPLDTWTIDIFQWNNTPNKCKQLFEYQHLLLLKDIWGQSSDFYLNVVHFFQHQCLWWRGDSSKRRFVYSIMTRLLKHRVD